MRIVYPYLVGRMHKPPRCRTERIVPFEETFTMEVPEATNEEAPIAFMRTDEIVRDNGRTREPQVIEYRWFGNQLWMNRPLRTTSLGVVEPSELYQNDVPRTPQESPQNGHYEEQPWWDTQFEQWRTNRLIVDGQWFHRTTEPMYHIDTQGNMGYGAQQPVRVKVVPQRHGGRNGWQYFYPLNWKKTAFDHAELLARKHRREGPLLPACEFRIFLSEAIRERRYHVYEFEIGSPTVSLKLHGVGHTPEDAVEALQTGMRGRPEESVIGQWGCHENIKLTANAGNLAVNQIISIDAYVES